MAEMAHLCSRGSTGLPRPEAFRMARAGSCDFSSVRCVSNSLQPRISGLERSEVSKLFATYRG